ncbi:hypothetical protein HYV79_03435 [Candidatus Woesearchaeota archaeon]|nr:hypothetical protein [Candidatus Woesearchaeota archaeon]
MKDIIQLILKRPMLFFSIIFIDIVFIFLYGGIVAYFQDKIADQFALMSPSLISLTKQDIFWNAPFLLFTQQNVWQYTKQIIIQSVLLYTCMLLLIVLFQGMTWWLSNNFFKKINFVKFIKKFTILSLILFTLYSILTVVDFFLAVRERVAERLSMPISELSQTVITIIIFTLIIYSLFCFSAQRFVFKKAPWKNLFLLAGLIAFVFLVLQAFLSVLNNISPAISVSAGFVLLFPLIAWARINLIEVFYGMDS